MSDAIQHAGADTAIAQLLERRRAYLPGWRGGPNDVGRGLLSAYAQHMSVLRAQLARLPERARTSFLDRLGARLLPAQAARTPLVFRLLEDAPIDVVVPARSRASATPVLTTEAALAATPPPSISFLTQNTFTVTRARLAALFSVVPADDAVGRYLARSDAGFTVFGDMEQAEHALYVAHDELLALRDRAEVVLTVTPAFAPDAEQQRELSIVWEYHSASGWLPFDDVDDQSAGMRRRGPITLLRRCGPDSAKAEFAGVESHWIRGRLNAPLKRTPRGDTDLPRIDTLKLQVRYSAADLRPDHVFRDVARLADNQDFAPFGAEPVLYTALYIACEAAFSRELARVFINFDMAQAGVGASPVVEWEYYNGTAWRSLLPHDVVDGTMGFTESHGTVSFKRPGDWAQARVQGERGFWVRARLMAGDYGTPLELQLNPPAVTPATFVPPIVATMLLGFAYVTAPNRPDHALTYNDFKLTDVSDQARWSRGAFLPYTPLESDASALYLGFDQVLPAGLVSVFVASANQGEAPPSDSGTAFVWEYLSTRGWLQLQIDDETHGLTQNGMLRFIGPPDMSERPVFGRPMRLVRARLRRSEPVVELPLHGLWINAVWAEQREAVRDDVLGNSDGHPGQTFALHRVRGAVLEYIDVEVNEWSGDGRDYNELTHGLDEDDFRLERDGSGAVTRVWVRWHEVPHHYDSGVGDRHFTVDRARGVVKFGDGRRGAIPTVGARLVAHYDSGGGTLGNVDAGAIEQIQAEVPFLDRVTNVLRAQGGADSEPSAVAVDRASHMLSHRERAVRCDDYAWLARDASPAVALAQCEPLRGPDGFAQRGWVAIRVLPKTGEPRPTPDSALRERIHRHLASRLPAVVANRVRVTGPRFVLVSVVVEIVPRDPTDAARLEARVRAALDAFLHPVSGGVGDTGWRFGEALHLSQVASVLSRIQDVRRIVQLRLAVGSEMRGDRIDVPRDGVVAAGSHELKLSMEGAAR